MIDNSYVPGDRKDSSAQSQTSAFEAVVIKVASPEVIRSWSHGDNKSERHIRGGEATRQKYLKGKGKIKG